MHQLPGGKLLPARLKAALSTEKSWQKTAEKLGERKCGWNPFLAIAEGVLWSTTHVDGCNTFHVRTSSPTNAPQ